MSVIVNAFRLIVSLGRLAAVITKAPNAIEPLQNAELDRLESTVRELIHHENELINQRIGWLVQSEGLLFAALAFSWQRAPRLSYILAAVGIATAVSIGSVTYLYGPAIRNVKKFWEDHVPEDRRKNRLIIGLSTPSGPLLKLLHPWRALP